MILLIYDFFSKFSQFILIKHFQKLKKKNMQDPVNLFFPCSSATFIESVKSSVKNNSNDLPKIIKINQSPILIFNRQYWALHFTFCQFLHSIG